MCNASSKYNCPNPIAGVWAPTILAATAVAAAEGSQGDQCRVMLELGFNSTLHEDYGAPASVTAVYSVSRTSRQLNVSLTWRNKTSTRLQEAMTLFNRPAQRQGWRWEMDKLGEWVAASNVTEGGEQYQHAVWSGVRYVNTAQPAAPGGLFLGTLDATLACPVLNNANGTLELEAALHAACNKYQDGPLPTAPKGIGTRTLKDSQIDGFGFNLHGNLFGISGFPQWYPFGVPGKNYQQQDKDTQFRFSVEEK